MKRAIPSLILIGLLAYVLSYMGYRSTHMESREENGKDVTYVIFPTDQKWVYYFYRPMSYVDGRVSGIQFHIGPHQPAADPTP
jgi:hypothetical protein